MQPLEPPETHYLSAAQGWVELGNLTEARAELAQISATRQIHPDVLEVRWFICAEEQHWEEGLQVARSLLHAAPDRASGWLHQAYALRRVSNGGVSKAWDALLPAFDLFPKESIIPYNLSCYACQLNQLETARDWFKRALMTGDKDQIKRMALADPDLEPLWPEIREL
jgi:tetratricopeptide (TPR) repeat protein